jgi:biotin carboxyl carrier protein
MLSRTARRHAHAALRRRTTSWTLAGLLPLSVLVAPGMVPSPPATPDPVVAVAGASGPSPAVAPLASLLVRSATVPSKERAEAAAPQDQSPSWRDAWRSTEESEPPEDRAWRPSDRLDRDTPDDDIDEPPVATADAAPEQSGPPAWDERRRHLEALVDVLGFDFGTTLTDADRHRAAERLGVEVGSPISDDDAEQLLRAHRQRASEAIRSLGFDHGSIVTNEDLLRAADEMDIDVGSFADPYDVVRIIRRAEVRADAHSAGLSSTRVAQAGTPLFASVDRVALHVPSKDVVLIGFHQAAFGVARQMRPHQNTKMKTLPSRRRGTGTRSAADISVKAGTPVLSPVNGRVVSVDTYALYGRYRDARINIVPSDNPKTIVTVLHVTRPRVKPGDTVEAGRTVLAKEATKFPFVSQIDRFAGDLPHVHVELRRR